MCILLTQSLFLEFMTIVACFKFKALDEVPVLLNLMGGEVMCFFICETRFIENPELNPILLRLGWMEGNLFWLTDSVMPAGQPLADLLLENPPQNSWKKIDRLSSSIFAQGEYCLSSKANDSGT